ncbi:unnamed protein product [Prorocentrum cordatum]|uniref:Uncharacterized protein n=1 Tax=Prorocentrum cordatum TaxID=2364126 RepID=A0ABN9RKK3_9DINO|nr:unnamed protein product [Polarella glacialis]
MRRWAGGADAEAYSSGVRACRAGCPWQAALLLLDQMWATETEAAGPTARDYEHVAALCEGAGAEPVAARLRGEVAQWGRRSPGEAPRFQVVPPFMYGSQFRGLRCSVRNHVPWGLGEAVPAAPERPCWFLPASDELAVEIARRQDEVRGAGWRVLT